MNTILSSTDGRHTYTIGRVPTIVEDSKRPLFVVPSPSPSPSVCDNYMHIIGDEESCNGEPERPAANNDSVSDEGFTFDPKKIADRFQKWEMEEQERRKNVIDNSYNGVLVCLKYLITKQRAYDLEPLK